MKTHDSHKMRFSDSSQYVEICDNCMQPDWSNCDNPELEKPCPCVYNTSWLDLCRSVKNSRNANSIFLHAKSEMDELNEEISLHEVGLNPGPDGVMGEAVDVILCMLDLIATQCPDVDENQLNQYMMKKFIKWKDIYSE